jgi:hypothetical protein
MRLIELDYCPKEPPTNEELKLIESEKYFRLSSEREISGRSWITHAVGWELVLGLDWYFGLACNTL